MLALHLDDDVVVPLAGRVRTYCGLMVRPGSGIVNVPAGLGSRSETGCARRRIRTGRWLTGRAPACPTTGVAASTEHDVVERSDQTAARCVRPDGELEGRRKRAERVGDAHEQVRDVRTSGACGGPQGFERTRR